MDNTPVCKLSVIDRIDRCCDGRQRVKMDGWMADAADVQRGVLNDKMKPAWCLGVGLQKTEPQPDRLPVSSVTISRLHDMITIRKCLAYHA